MSHKSAVKEPIYSFTIPSLSDDLPLDCRIYHPKELDSTLEHHDKPALKSAVLAHPYPPLGGSYDDPVILSTCEALLGKGYLVTTFNFRGAGDSAGRTSWTSKPEVEDFASVAGLSIYYTHHLRTQARDTASDTPYGNNEFERDHSSAAPVTLLLGGYSFGSLILARLPPIQRVVARFENAGRGTAASEVFLRARTLAKQTLQEALARPATSRGRGLTVDQPPGSPMSRASPVTVGGEETDPSERRRSRETKHSAEVIREMPHKIKSHIRKHGGAQTGERPLTASPMNPGQPVVNVAYLIISPVLVPFRTTLLPPGISLSNQELGLFPASNPTLAVFGSGDTFSSSKKLRQWAEGLATASSKHFQWEQVDGAGHFWREQGVMGRLQSRVARWTAEVHKA